MKRTIYVIMAFLFAAGVQAQVVDHKGLDAFIDELKKLNGEHVECTWDSHDKLATEDSEASSAHLEFLPDMLNISVGGMDFELASICKSDTTFRFVVANSNDDVGYMMICAVLDKYEAVDNEEFFGIPLMANNREDGEQQIVYMGGRHTLIISDDGEDISVLYGTFNLMECLQNLLGRMPLVGDADVEMLGGINFSVSVDDKAALDKSPGYPGASPEEIMRFAREIADDNVACLESRTRNAGSDGEREEHAAMVAEFKSEKEENLEELKKKLDELEGPEFIEIIPGTDEYYVAIPKVSPELEAAMKPYAKSGIYDWINSTGFGSGAKKGSVDQVSCIVTPHDIAREYVIRNLPRDRWYDDGFTAEYKELAAREYQGGTPAVLYRFSHNEQGYNDMLSDLGWIFGLEPGEKHWNLEVTQRSENNGKRFVQLWGEGGVLVCLFDSPAEKYCHFSVIVGGVSGFEKAVNEYFFGGERDFANKCNIIIDSNFSDNTYGIHFTADDYFYAGKMYGNGVHVDFGYARMFTGVE
ncbi:MAG: hypothetical protein IKU76_06680 [Bacteroidaceae bacterium]|nr:hypothetical protein [Bacteroidaceae bacterium]